MLREQLKHKIFNYLKNNKILMELGISGEFKVEFLAQGEYNVNYVFFDENNKYVFRVNLGSQIDVKSQILYEFDAIKRLEVSEVTPKVYYVDDSMKEIPYGILVMEFLKGEHLIYKNDLNKAAFIFSKIHTIKLEEKDFQRFLVEENVFSKRIEEGNKLLKDYLKSPFVDKERKNFFYEFLNLAEKNCYKEQYFLKNKIQVINNTEVNSGNFIIGKEKSYLIDWEKPVISDPCQDLTQFLAPTTTLWKANYILSDEEKEKFFQTYSENSGYLKSEIKERVNLYNPYLYLRALGWCAYAWLEYKNPNKDIKNMDTLKKIEQYLEIDFMKKLVKF